MRHKIQLFILLYRSTHIQLIDFIRIPAFLIIFILLSCWIFNLQADADFTQINQKSGGSWNKASADFHVLSLDSSKCLQSSITDAQVQKLLCSIEHTQTFKEFTFFAPTVSLYFSPDDIVYVNGETLIQFKNQLLFSAKTKQSLTSDYEFNLNYGQNQLYSFDVNFNIEDQGNINTGLSMIFNLHVLYQRSQNLQDRYPVFKRIPFKNSLVFGVSHQFEELDDFEFKGFSFDGILDQYQWLETSAYLKILLSF